LVPHIEGGIWLRMFQNRVLRRIFDLTRDKVPGDGSELNNEEHNHMHSSPNIIWKNEMGRACSMYDVEVHTGFCWGNLRGREHLEHPGEDERIILRWIFRRLNGEGVSWTGLIWLRAWTGGGHL
jgi:hypothetical protein